MKGFLRVYGCWGCGIVFYSFMIFIEKVLLVKNFIVMIFLWYWENIDWGKLFKVIIENKCFYVLIVKLIYYRG